MSCHTESKRLVKLYSLVRHGSTCLLSQYLEGGCKRTRSSRSSSAMYWVRGQPELYETLFQIQNYKKYFALLKFFSLIDTNNSFLFLLLLSNNAKYSDSILCCPKWPQLPEDRTTTLESNTLVMSEPTLAIPVTEHSGSHCSLFIK